MLDSDLHLQAVAADGIPNQSATMVKQNEQEIASAHTEESAPRFEPNNIQAAPPSAGLRDFEPNQLQILITRLRQERDESRRAVQFLNIEHASLVQASHNAVVQLRNELQIHRETRKVERNELILAMALLRKNSIPLNSADTLSHRTSSDVSLKGCTGCTTLERELLEVQHQLRSSRRGTDTFNPNLHYATSALERTQSLCQNPMQGQTQQPMQIESNGAPTEASKHDIDVRELSSSPNTIYACITNQQNLSNGADVSQDLLGLKNWGSSEDSQPVLPVVRGDLSLLDLLGDLDTQEKLDLNSSSLTDFASAQVFRSQVHTLKSKITSLEESIEAYRADIAARDKDICDMKNRLSDVQPASSNFNIMSDASDNVSHSPAMSTYRKDRELEAESGVRILEEQQALVAELTQRTQTTAEERDSMQKTLQDTLDIVSELKVAQASSQCEMEEIEKHCSTLCVQLQQTSDQLTQAEERLKTMKYDSDAAKNEHELLRAELSEKLKTASENLAALQQEKEKSFACLEAAIRELSHGLDESKIDRKRTIDQQQGSPSRESARTDLSDQLTVASTKLANMQREKEETCASTEDKIIELNAVIRECRSRAQRLATQLDSQEVLNTRQELDRIDLTERLSRATARMEDLEREKDERTLSFEDQIKSLQRTIDQLRAENEQYADRPDQAKEANAEHERIQKEMSDQLVQASSKLQEIQCEKEERVESLDMQIKELTARLEASDAESFNLANQLSATLESSEASKQAWSDDLSQTREDLKNLHESRAIQSERYLAAEEELRSLRAEVTELKVQQGLSDELAKEFDALVVEFEAQQNKLQESLDEAATLRLQIEENSRLERGMKSDLEDRDALISSLKADLTTVSKLHQNMPSLAELSEKMNELEARLETKTSEAEDALDQLIEQLQKNKRLSNMVENLKVKIKAKDKHAVRLEPSQPPMPVLKPTIPSVVPSPATRKRKLDYVTSAAGVGKSNPSSKVMANENGGSSSEMHIPRKTIHAAKLASCESHEGLNADAQPLQSRSVNSMANEDNSRRRLRDRSSSGSKVGKPVQASAHLLASIQSLRKRQQQQAAGTVESGGQTSLTRSS